MASADDATPLKSGAQGIRDAAKYLIAAYGAIGAVLVGSLSLAALPSSAHPIIATAAIATAVLALTFLIGLGISVLTPKTVTLGRLAELEESGSTSSVVKRLKSDEELFIGQGTSLSAFHKNYVRVLNDRAAKQEAYLENLDNDHKLKSEVASSRAQFLDEAASHVLEIASIYQLEERFSPRRRAGMALLALVVVAGVGVFAWASPAPPKAEAAHPQAQVHYRERIWLEHLIATSGYRIEKLEQEAEGAATVATASRVDRALEVQRRVERREHNALGNLVAGGGG